MPVLELLKERDSVRMYKPKSIPRKDLMKILEAARLSQSAANSQPWEFVVVTDRDIKAKLVSATDNQAFVGEAAAVIGCLADPNKSARVGPFEGFLIDLAIAIENMALTAWDLGIGSCWIGAFNEEEVKQLLDVPENLRVVSLLTLGYPNQRPREKLRRSLEEIAHFQKYGQKES